MRKLLIAGAAIGVLICQVVPADSGDSVCLAIRGVRIVPVVGAVIPKGTILIRGGRIEAVGVNPKVPADARIIEAEGLSAYPGMIDACTSLGLVELSNVAATADVSEIGAINPQLKAVEAVKPDSVHIPIARAAGITVAHVVPQGAFVAGQSGLIRLNGRIPRDLVVRESVAMRIQFQAPPQYVGGKIIPGNTAKIAKELKDLLDKARLYRKLRAATAPARGEREEFNEALEFLGPVVEGALPVMLAVESREDIEGAIRFVKEERLKAILFGAPQAWKVADKIKAAGLPIILDSLYAFPGDWEDGYDALYRNASILYKAGVPFAFSSNRYLPPFCTDLPDQASKAVAFGLDPEEALRAVTIRPAEILGVAGLMGSLEAGKAANIVLTDGDLLDRRTAIKRVFIDGRSVDLSTRFTELLDRYKR